jgi:bis(5'-nucleosyl)-tetraphosphatase (symmetrical)
MGALETAGSGRRIFVGDIQGCREELERLLEAVAFEPARDRVYPTGDLVNRGPDSLGCLRLLRALEARPVLGNHDLRLLRISRGQRAASERDTLDEVLRAADRDELLAWLASQPFIRSFADVYLVHAGLHPHWLDPERELAGLSPFVEHASTRFVTRVRRCDAEGRIRDAAPDCNAPGVRPWFRFYRPERHAQRAVVFGHWSERQGVNEPFLRGLDTGCVWGGKLTAWIAEENRRVQVPAARAYLPVDA